jgi:hypothetical protein
MRPSLGVTTSKAVFTSTQSLLRWTFHTLLYLRVKAHGHSIVATRKLATLAVVVIVESTVVLITYLLTTCISTFHRIRIPIYVRRITVDRVVISIMYSIFWLRFSENLWDSVALDVVRIFHISMPSIFWVAYIVLIFTIIHTIIWIMCLRQRSI